MKFIECHNTTDGAKLSVSSIACPEPASNEVLVKVQASGINRADILQKQGKYPPPKGDSEILGIEISGVISEVGKNCHKFKVGQKVCAIVSGGGYAEYVTVVEDHLLAIPDNMTFVEAAAVPETFLTAFQALFVIGQLKPGEVALIHAGASGVGSAAIQLAKLHGATVVTTVGSSKKETFCSKLGADFVINYRNESFPTFLKSNGIKVDVILDVIGGSYWEDNLNCLNLDGRIVNLAMLGARFAQQLDFAKMLQKRASLSASTLRNRDHSYKSQLVHQFLEQWQEHLCTGRLKPALDSVYSVQDVEKAHERMENNLNMGKIILDWSL